MTAIRPEPDRLRRGKAFHRAVQAEWKNEAEGRVESEAPVAKPNKKSGRIDILVDAEGGVAALVEIKNSDWDRMTPAAVRRNVRRQIRQIWGYIEGQPNQAAGVCPGVVFPRRPRDPQRLKLIEQMFLDDGIPVVWQDETMAVRASREGPTP